MQSVFSQSVFSLMPGLGLMASIDSYKYNQQKNNLLQRQRQRQQQDMEHMKIIQRFEDARRGLKLKMEEEIRLKMEEEIRLKMEEEIRLKMEEEIKENPKQRNKKRRN